MTSVKAIGGYFELDGGGGISPLPNGVLLNSGRNALRHIVRELEVSRIHVPYYTCPVVWDVLKAEGCELDFYEIGVDFKPTELFPKNDFVLYTNYFGCCGGIVDELAVDYPNLIVDCAQAYYARPKGRASFSSPRKFFGVPDGGVAYGVQLNNNKAYDIDDSSQRCAHLELRAEGKLSEGYKAYQISEHTLENAPIRLMSTKTSEMLLKVDSIAASITRKKNFNYLRNMLGDTFPFSLTEDDVPMVFPYIIDDISLRQRLIDNKIYVAKYWPNVYNGDNLSERIVPLPIDSRYGEEEMRRIVFSCKTK